MDRRRFLLTSLAGTIVAPLAAEAQTVQARVGMLGTRLGSFHEIEHPLRELGWVEGRTITIERRVAPSYEALEQSARGLAQLGVNVIVCTNAPAVKAAMNVTRTIPIVMAPAGDPIGAGFISSLARPGGNVTGVAIMHTELSGKRLELLSDAVPAAKRVAVLANPKNPSTRPMLRETVARSRVLGIDITAFEATNLDQLASRFAAMVQQRVAGVVVLGDPFFFAAREKVVGLAIQHRLPAVCEWDEMAEAGALIAYGPRLDDLRRRAANYVDKILKGANPSDLAVEQPTQFRLVINLRTAKALGLTIPPSLLLRADQVIE